MTGACKDDEAVIQRGQSILVCDVAVTDAAGQAVARALVTYKLTHRERG